MRSKTIFKSSIAISTAAILAAGILGTPARAAGEPVTITIWTFGDVIQRQLVQEYKNLHPEVSLQIKKSDLDPLNGTNMVTACTSKTGPDIVAVEVQYSGYWRSYPKCFTDLRKMKTSETNVVAGVAAGKTALDFKKNYLPWRWEQGVGYDESVIVFQPMLADSKLHTVLTYLRKPVSQPNVALQASYGQLGISSLRPVSSTIKSSVPQIKKPTKALLIMPELFMPQS